MSAALMHQSHFVEAHDILFFRGNKLFGEAGSFGDLAMPPSPSVISGALRSSLLSHDRFSFSDFKTIAHPALGTASAPGSFVVRGFSLARRMNGSVEPVFALPADLTVVNDEMQGLEVRKATPQKVHKKLQSSSMAEFLPILAESERTKALKGFWLDHKGWKAYLNGEKVLGSHLVPTNKLWLTESRVGIGMSTKTGAVEDGKLFTSEAICPLTDVGFVVHTSGADLSELHTLRFGGDGRAARIKTLQPNQLITPEPDYEKIATSKRLKLVLTSPGLFEEGWKPTGVNQEWRLELGNVKGQLVCAAVSQNEVVSGFDLARWMPKPAERAVSTGGTYWLGNVEASAADLRKLAKTGLWNEQAHNTARRVEGFNAVAVCAW